MRDVKHAGHVRPNGLIDYVVQPRTVQHMKPSVRLLAVVLLVIVLAAVLATRGGGRTADEVSLDPTTWFAPQWSELLGGDAPTKQAQTFDTAALAQATDLPPRHVPAVSTLMGDLAFAAASGSDRILFGAYFARNHGRIGQPTIPGGEFCRDVSVLAVSSFTLPLSPSGSFVKSLVAWTGTCPYPPSSLFGGGSTPLYVNFLYAARVDAIPYEVQQLPYGGWVPLHPTELPNTRMSPGIVSTPSDEWEVRNLATCSRPNVAVRIEVAVAFEALCQETNGLPLLAINGLRTPEEQSELFKRAVSSYGSERAARARVAYSDGAVCESMHCAGEAIDVAPDEGVLKWLQAEVACLTPSGVSAAPCGPGVRSVSRLERYGFITPHANQPYHIEFALGTLDADADLYGDCTPGGVPLRERIVAVFTCRIMEAGLGYSTPSNVIDAALAVAQCTSNFDPGFVAHGGKYVERAHPRTGNVDTRAGIFGLSADVATRWIAPPYAVSTATANIDAAARIYIDERSWGRWGWGQFACATADDGFITDSVLVG